MPVQTSRRRQHTTRFARESESQRPTRNGVQTRRVQRDQPRGGGRRSAGRGSPYEAPRTGRTSRRGVSNQKPIAGFISLGCFGLYAICIAVLISTAVNILSGGAIPEHLGNLAMLAVIAAFAPWAGIAAGVIGILNKKVSKAPSIIGLCLNALPALLVLRGLLS